MEETIRIFITTISFPVLYIYNKCKIIYSDDKHCTSPLSSSTVPPSQIPSRTNIDHPDYLGQPNKRRSSTFIVRSALKALDLRRMLYICRRGPEFYNYPQFDIDFYCQQLLIRQRYCSKQIHPVVPLFTRVLEKSFSNSFDPIQCGWKLKEKSLRISKLYFLNAWQNKCKTLCFQEC